MAHLSSDSLLCAMAPALAKVRSKAFRLQTVSKRNSLKTKGFA